MVKYCVKKYVCDEYKAGSLSEKSLKKAEELVYSYARVVYSEVDMEHMRMDMLRMAGLTNPNESGINQSNARQTIT